MFSSRSTGHAIGKTLFAGAAAAAGAMFFAPGILIAGVGFACLGGGAYLHEKLYLDDPEAVAEYRQELDAKPLSTLLDKKFSIENLLQIVNANQIREYYEKEISDDRISTALRAYGVAKLKLLHIKNVVSINVFIRQSNKELDEHSRNFTEFWQNTQQEMPELVKMNFVSLDQVKQKFLTEFSWVGSDGQLYHHEEPADGRYIGIHERNNNNNNDGDDNRERINNNDTNDNSSNNRLKAGEPIGLVRAFNQYFTFATTRLGMNAEFFQVALQSSVYGRKTSLPLMIQEGLIQLALTSSSNTPIVDKNFVQNKLEQYLANSPNNNNKNNNMTTTDNRFASTSCSVSSDMNNSNNDNNNNNQNDNSNQRETALTLWKAEEEINVKELLEKGLIVPSNSLLSLFHSALPRNRAPGFGWDYNDGETRQSASSTSSSSRQKMSHENNIVLFCDYWEPIFKKFQNDPNANFIELEYSYSALSAWRRGVDAKKEKERKVAEAERLYDRTKSQLDEENRTLESAHSSGARNRASENARTKKLQEAACSLKDDTIERAGEDYKKELKLIHEDFCAQISGQYTHHHQSSRNSNRSSGGCAQQ